MIGMARWFKERIEIGRLARERADRLVEENRMLRILAEARQQEVDRLNKVIDEVQGVVMGWSRASKPKSEIGV